MSPKRRFNMWLEPKQVEILREIERRTGAPVSEQIRRAIDTYLRTQAVITQKEIKQILKR
jgi:hypothetical protein